MKELSLERINEKSPYQLRKIKDGFEFFTVNNIQYRIYFTEEEPLGGCETIQFIINKVDGTNSAYDSNISAVTFIVIDEFFSENDDVLLYICDTSDHREAGRNRLFLHWFEKAANPNRFTIRTANTIVEGEGFYAAIIVENKNPKLNEILDDFDATASALEK